MTDRESRVLHVRGLTPGARMVLFYLAHGWPEGREEQVVNRAELARLAECSAEQVRRAITLGETVGLLATRQGGLVAFRPPGLPIADAPPPPKPVAREPKAPAEPPSADRPAPQEVLAEFARQWEAQYRCRYVFEQGKDHRQALVLSRAMTREEVAARVRNYLRHPDAYYGRCMHAFSLFVKRINEFGSVERRERTPPGTARIAGPEETKRMIEAIKRGRAETAARAAAK